MLTHITYSIFTKVGRPQEHVLKDAEAKHRRVLKVYQEPMEEAVVHDIFNFPFFVNEVKYNSSV